MLCDAGAAAAAERPQPLLLPLIEMMQGCDTQHPALWAHITAIFSTRQSSVAIYIMYISTVSLVISVQYCGVQLSI